MSCPDWTSLLEHRLVLDRGSGLEEPAEWPAAVEHLDDCPACRVRALSLDPSLLFLVQAPEPVSDDEVSQIKANVRTLVRARAADRASQRVRRGLGRLIAAAAVVALMVLLPTHTSRQPLTAPAAEPSLATGTGPLALSDGLLGEASAPVVEPIDLPQARIYQLGERDLPIVMVVEESIDV